MVAVLLMMAILLVGILFVALVTYNQEQSTRHEDTLAAQAMAEAGIRYATYMLENSPEGADWRPPEPPALYVGEPADPGVYGPDTIPGTEDDYYTDMELSRGWAPRVDLASEVYENRGFTRYPDPRHPSGAATALATSVDGGYFFLRVTYQPWDPNAADDPDPMNWHIKIESIGRVEGTQIHRTLVAYKPIPTLNYARWVHDATQDGRPAFLGIPAWADRDLDGNMDAADWMATAIDGPVRVNGRLEVAGTPEDPTVPPDATPSSTQFVLHKRLTAAEIDPGEFPRDDKMEITGGIEMYGGVSGAADVVLADDDSDPAPWVSLLPSDDPNFDTIDGNVRDGRSGLDADGDPRYAQRIEAPRLTLGEGETVFERYRRLTRDSGDLVDVDGEYVNSGQWGYGRGIYIDNFGDIQFDHDIQALIDDWQRPAGTPGTPMPDSGWNALFTTYSPPAVEIEFMPTEDAVGAFEVSLNPGDVGPDEVWWPGHETGQPGIQITRYDDTWRAPDGTDSGLRTLVMDYPTPWLTGTDDTVRYPLIVTEGNVRVSGRLPAGTTATDLRLYDLAIVSGGTIYIDGQILAPNDYLTTPVAPELNTSVALMARDCVCLNATQIVPQDTFGTAPAVPDDPLNPADPNKHWDLSPGSDGRGYSLFYWGEPPVSETRNLVVRQTAGDPGPSGMSLTLWDETSNDYTAYDFGDPPAPMDENTFALVPEDTIFWDTTTGTPYYPPQPYGVEAVEPQWAPYSDADALLPWDLAGYLVPDVGIKNALVLAHSDPQLGAGSTSYWLKRWKIAEYNADGNPIGAINARVNASVFAERGCWYVLTPGYFDETLDARDVDTDADDVMENRRYNYRVTFVGTIAENFTASVEAAADWHDKMGYPEWDTTGDFAGWGTVNYEFDETLRTTRFDSTVSDSINPAANLPRLPLLPVSPDLVYYGD
ncbi:MAG: hypothetical protein ACOCZ7_00010 [Armatimonadota bacterium]